MRFRDEITEKSVGNGMSNRLATGQGTATSGALLPETVEGSEARATRTSIREAPVKSRALRIKKIPVHLRRGKPAYRSEPLWHRRILKRLREDSQYQRSDVQLAFVLL